jgi:hypothetical protein
MPIVVAEERVFPVSDLPDHVPPRRGRKQHISTGFRWVKAPGVRGVVLETVRVGGTLYTSTQALQRFFNALSATDARPDHGAAPRSPAGRSKAADKADRELASLGF